MKKLSVVLIALLIVFAFAACGEEGDSTPGEAETAAVVSSANGFVQVTPAEGFTAVSSEYEEMVIIRPDGIEENSDYIEIEAPNALGYYQTFQFEVYSDSPYQYDKEAPYTMDMLRSDIDTYIAAYPNIYSNPTDVTIGSYDYIRVDCVTNGEASNYYYTIVNDKPCTVAVVGGESLDIASAEVTAMIESIVFTVE